MRRVRGCVGAYMVHAADAMRGFFGEDIKKNPGAVCRTTFRPKRTQCRGGATWPESTADSLDHFSGTQTRNRGGSERWRRRRGSRQLRGIIRCTKRNVISLENERFKERHEKREYGNGNTETRIRENVRKFSLLWWLMVVNRG